MKFAMCGLGERRLAWTLTSLLLMSTWATISRAVPPPAASSEAPLAVSSSAASSIASFAPWSEAGDVPTPAWARSVEVLRDDEALSISPGGARRGVVRLGTRLPLLGSVRGPGCLQRWLLVGPLAYVCTDRVRYSSEPPRPAPNVEVSREALPYTYFVVGRDGASAYSRPADRDEGVPVEELEPGWFVATAGEIVERGQRFVLTRKGHFVARSELIAATPSSFHGYWLHEEPSNERPASETRPAAALSVFDVAWVLPDRAEVFAEPATKLGKPVGVRTRLERLAIHETRQVMRPDGKSAVLWLRIGASEWIRDADVRRPSRAELPAEVRASERWIDVDTGSQTLVAYEGDRAVFATVVSTGRAATPTPKGLYRIWVKLRTSTMSNADDVQSESASSSSHYSIQDVPWVQYFSHGIALHAAFWHRRFGTPYSHGCVNLAPIDAFALFSWTMPRVPLGWDAVFPTVAEPATFVRVR